MNPNNDRDRDNLFRAMDVSRRRLAPFRRDRLELIDQYIGSRYGDNHQRKRTYVRYMAKTLDAYVMLTAANNPQYSVSVEDPQLRPFATRYRLTLNNLVNEIHLYKTLQLILLDAFFGLGIAKVCLGDSVALQVDENAWVDPGKLFVCRISMDNWVHDMTATEIPRMKYMGDYYRVPFSNLEDRDVFENQDVVKLLMPNSRFASEVRQDGETHAADITVLDQTDDDEIEPMIDLIDVWLPREKLIATYAANGRTKPLAVRAWDGPENGPYRILTLADVPDNTLPVTPAQVIAELEAFTNRMWRKMSKQAAAQRNVTAFEPGAEDDSRRIQQSDTEAFINVKNLEAIKQFKTGGVEPTNQIITDYAVGELSRMAGNLDAALGLGAQSDTATQDQLIHSQVSRQEARLQQRVVDFTAGIGQDLGWILWVDPLREMELEIPIEGTSITIPARWTPQDREADFWQYNFKVVPFSTAYQSPSQQAQALDNSIINVAIPLAQQLQAVGGSVDLQAYFHAKADLLNLPELRNIVRFDNPYPVPPATGQSPEESPMPSVTTRRYERKNIPTGGTEESRRHIRMQSLLDSGQANPDQMNSMERQPA